MQVVDNIEVPEPKGSSRRRTLESFVEQARLKHGLKYTYLALDFSGRNSKIKLVCPEHGEFTQSTSSHLKGSGCWPCSNKLRGAHLKELKGKPSRKRMTDEEFFARAAEAQTRKWEYGELVREDAKTYIHVKCEQHGWFKQLAATHMKGQGCFKCGAALRGKNRRTSEEETRRRIAEVHGDTYGYGDITFKNGKSYIDVVCKKHGLFTQWIPGHLEGKGCQSCGDERVGLQSRWTFDEFVYAATSVHGNTYTYNSLNYEDGKPVAEIVCSSHGIFKQNVAYHVGGSGCPTCGSNRISKPNQEVAEFIESLELEVILEHKIGRKFLDIYIPSLKLAFEYNGNYWHSSKFTHSSAHKEKSEFASQHGIRLIHIFSHEWKFNQEVVKKYIRRACQVPEAKIFARKTNIIQVSAKEAEEFLTEHHIQGYTPSDYVGLKYNDQLVAVMGFSKRLSARGQNTSNTTELTRYATSCNVVGGFSRLLATNTDPHIVSYSDNRMFAGITYEKNGFTKVGVSQPDYKYVEQGRDDTLKHKANYQKSRLAQRFGVEACQGKTERQITEENGLYRVYDCGKTKWELKR